MLKIVNCIIIARTALTMALTNCKTIFAAEVI